MFSIGNLLRLLCISFLVNVNRVVTSESVSTNIIGGEPSPVGRYPYFAHPRGSFLCGATLIHEDILLTAAHCNDGNNFVNTRAIYIGSTKFNGSDALDTLTAVSFKNHPDFQSIPFPKNLNQQNSDENLIYDYSLVKLSRPTTVTPAMWNNDQARPVDNEELITIGFGHTSQSGSTSNVLLEVKLNVTNFETCDTKYGNVLDATSELCAASPGKDSCYGDSGGPILDANGTIVGIVSTGIGCAIPQFPGLYSRVSSADAFIRQGICEMSSNPPEYCNSICFGCSRTDGLGNVMKFSIFGQCLQLCTRVSVSPFLSLLGGKCGKCPRQ